MFLDINDIKIIHLDHTSRCNLMCPQCARVHNNNVNPSMPIRDLTVSDYEIIFNPFKGKDIRIFHCGNYGDVIASPTFNDTLDWCNNNGFNNITIITNGSARNTEWWKNLAKKVALVAFSIDGLHDTSHIYRVNSNFDKIIENIKAFTSVGGNARWDYLVFEHNHHQIEEAKNFAKSIGIKKFNVKHTARFLTQTGYKSTITNKKNELIFDKKNNHNLKNLTDIVKSYGSFDEYIKKTTVSCKAKNEEKIYIDFEMRVWPCCWLGAPIFFHDVNNQTQDIHRMLDKYGRDFNRLDLHTWNKILSHDFYEFYLEYTWKNNEDRFYTCGRTCGTNFESSSGYGDNRNVQKLP